MAEQDLTGQKYIQKWKRKDINFVCEEFKHEASDEEEESESNLF